MYIYKIINNINGKIYVGKTTKTIRKRFDEHIHNVKYGLKQNRLYSAMKSYGIENFLVEQLDEASTNEELCKKEIYWIKKLNSSDPDIGYNIALGGNGGATWSPKGTVTVNNGEKNLQIQPEELETYLANGWLKGGHRCAKRPNAGKWVNNGTKQKRVQPEELDYYLSNGWSLGYSDKGRKNLSKSHLGKEPWNKGGTLSEEQKNNVSNATKAAMNTPEIKAKMRAIYDSRKGNKWVTNGKASLQVKEEDIQYYIDKGFILGRKLRKEGDVSE